MPGARAIRRLPGLSDLTAAEIAAAESVAAVCRELFARRGYRRTETPLLEETDLFLRKSGGELASRLYNFTEPGGYPVSLRPEYTAPMLRHAIEAGALTTLPLRYQYCGPVFRHTVTAAGEGQSVPRQFTQLGAELIGAPPPRADGEVIGMAWQGLNALHTPLPKVVIGHVGLLWDLLRPYGLSERVRLFLINSVGTLRGGKRSAAEVRQQAKDLGLLVGRAGVKASRGIPGLAADAGGERATAIVESVLSQTLGQPAVDGAGSRTADEIVARLARRLGSSDDPQKFDAALDVMSSLAVIQGPVKTALKEGSKVVRAAGSETQPFDQVQAVVEAAVDEGVPEGSISVDLGLARGIAYYTGMVFDLAASNDAREVSLGGGGRYDGLLKALGAGMDAPALGFAYNLDAVVAAMPRNDDRPQGAGTLVAPDSPDAAAAAAKHASRLRERGEVAVLHLEAGDKDAPRRFARGAGIRKIATVTASGRVSEEAV